MITGKIVRLNGALTIEYKTRRDSVPFEDTLYWPISEDRSRGAIWRLEGHDVTSDLGSPFWRIAPTDADFWQLKDIYVASPSKARHVACTLSSAAARPYRSFRRAASGAGAAAPVAGYSSWCTDRPGCGCYDCAS